MRFALPDELDYPGGYASTQLLVKYPVCDATIEPLGPRVTKPPSRDDVNVMYNLINAQTNEWMKHKAREMAKQQTDGAASFQHIQDQYDSTIQLLSDKFNTRIQLQNQQVEKVIQDEKTRIRLAQEAERRRLEEEARRKRLEQERLQREEEERRRKEEARQKAEQERLEAERKQREAEEKRRKEEQRKREEAARLKAEQAESEKQRAEQLKKEQEQATTNFKAIEEQFFKYKQDIQDIKTQVVAPLDGNKELKKQVNQYKRKINPKFGQLSNSLSHTRTVSMEVYNLVVATQSNELVYKWILNFIAKAIIDQAETEVIVRPFAARPLATLAYFLLEKFPDFEYFLTARFIKKCPYILGYTCSIDSEEGRKRMGWKRNQDNKWEDDVKYDERVGGICTVWSVMTHESNAQIGIYSNASSWQFVARMLNTDLNLIRNTHFELLANWWEAAGGDFANRYGNQSKKLMFTMAGVFVDAVASKRFPAAARLRLLGEEWQSRGTIQGLKQMEN
ncbi:GLE1-like family protein [Candida parapsilosis]|uniref:mRNA export factor GLE1 n=2 Tax=Candida parapsilosis TaxID=5480 RepID=G8B786_CANPC|nr:uncharacterized protein CPAR2_103570 [Candida parapsilosis]KAF6048299.1 GLE1-like family protein [Candida parapsilosis]KAF6049735.1 GLE1-like family protein [Candida parapsilosis]KAF6057597.1 GLE1-like family protein [Candida parapsilosis]KAF6065695.1 GLE1-like family protein [Candida parapsilosis]KAI5904596.1 Nucleoporin GLE1 [Candida parapsilosis]